MAKRKLKFDEESKPGVNYILLFPIRFSTSAPLSVLKKIDKYCKANKMTKSQFFRKMQFDFLNIKNENELLAKYPKIRKIIQRESKAAILDEMGVNDGDMYSEWIIKHSEKAMKFGRTPNTKKK